MPRGLGRAILTSSLFLVAVLWVNASITTEPSVHTSAAVGAAQSFGASKAVATLSLTASTTAASTAGDMLVATIRVRSTTSKLATVVSVTDAAGNTWVRATSVTQGNTNDGEIWITANARSTTSVTVKLTASSALAFTVLDVAGASATAPLDRTATRTGTSSAPSVGPTANTTQANEIVIADIGWNSTPTPSKQTAGYTATTIEQSTVPNTATGEQAAWRVLSATGAATYAATMKSSVAWTAEIATFDISIPSPTPTPTVTPTPTPTPPPPSVPHVMVIVEGDQSYGAVVGSSNAPYITGLSKSYRSATNWYAIQHNLQTDDLDLIAGSSLGLPNGTPYSTATVVDELHEAGVPWKTYVESMPSNCFAGTTTNGLYDRNHNPFHDFTNDTSASGGWCSSVNLSTEGVVAYPGSSGLAKALDAANAPDFVYLVPNDCDDMQGDAVKGSSCAGDSTAKLIKAGDAWLSSNLAPVLNSAWFKHNGTVIITWDQSVAGDTTGCCGLSSPGGHIPTIVVAAANKGYGAFAMTGDHFGTLRAVEETYGLGLLGASGPAGNTVNGDLGGAFAGPTTGAIGGVVTDSTSGTPIPGAAVSYVGANGDGSTNTGSGGAYTLSGVPIGTYQVSASAAGYSQAASPATVTAGSTTALNLALTSTVGTISGTALDSQTPAEPVATAIISYSGPNGSGSTSIVNAATGAFTLTGVPVGTFTITATAPGYGTQTTLGVVVSGGTTTANVDFVMQAASGVTGLVSDTEKPAQPIAGATVLYSGTGGTPGSGSTLTGTDGAYTLSGVPAGTYSVSVSDNGFTAPTPIPVTVSANQTNSGVNFIVTANSQISGAVTDSETPPQLLSGATVRYAGTGTTTGAGSVATAATGLYTLMGVPPGTYLITASQPGFTSPAGQLVTVPPDGTGTEVIALTATSGLSGTAIDPVASQALPDATVTYTGTTGDVARATATTGGNGAYAFAGVSPGVYTVTAAECGFVSPSPETVTVGAGATAIVPALSLAPVATTALCGTVVDSQTAQPVVDAMVTYTDTSDVTSSPTLTDMSGGYSFDGLVPGTYTVDATAQGYATASHVVTLVSGGLVVPDLDVVSTAPRDAFTQPFTSASIWNMPIGSDAQYEPANLQPATKSTLVSDQHIILMTPTAPPTALDYGPGGQTGDRCTDSGMTVATIPIAAAFTVPTSGMNDPLVAVASDGHTLIQTEPFARCVVGGPATAKGPVVLGDLYGDGQLGGDGGSGLSALGGSIRLGELVPGGAIDHALQIDIDGANLYHGTATTCYRWPATKCDSYGPGTGTTAYKGTNPDLAMGALLALPRSLDLATLGLQTEPGMILATALQDYGAYVANDAARSVNNIVTETGPSGSVVTNFGLPVTDGGFGFPFVINGVNGTDPWSEDIATIFAHLDIVTNNGPTSTGGGGTPIVPMAAPLG